MQRYNFYVIKHNFSNKEIMELREYEFRHSNLISSSKYIKQRGYKNE